MTLLQRVTLYAVYCSGVSFASLGVINRLVEHSSRDASASHVVLVPLVSIALLWWDRQLIFAAPAFAFARGLAVIVAGAVLAAALRMEWLPIAEGSTLSASVFALVVMWVGGFLLLFGTRSSRRALFPLVFLAFTAPIPQPALDVMVEILKRGSASAVAGLFGLSGTPYLREEFIFHVPTVSIEIADACSGIRSSIALLLTSLLVGHVSLDRGWKRLVLALVVLPITIVKNGIRIVTLTLLSVHVDPSFLTGQLHHEGGIVFFVLALVMLAPVVALLSGGLPRLSVPRDIVARPG